MHGDEQMSVKYDSTIIEEHARQLYDRAMGIIVLYALGGGLPAFLGVWMIVKGGMLEAGLAGLFGGLLGAVIGRGKAFELRLQAQLALCQARIERNTDSALQVLHALRAPVASVPPVQTIPQQHWAATELHHGSRPPGPPR